MHTVEDKLNNIINDQEDKIESLEAHISDLENRINTDWRWSVHKEIEVDDPSLPVPRLQISYKSFNNDYGMTGVWLYCLIYKHTVGDIIQIPLGSTKTDGYGKEGPRIDDLPYRDGVHIKKDAHQLNLPAYSIVNGEILELDPITE